MERTAKQDGAECGVRSGLVNGRQRGSALRMRRSAVWLVVLLVGLAAALSASPAALAVASRPPAGHVYTAPPVLPLLPQALTLLKREFAAIQSGNYALFLKSGSPRFDEISKSQFGGMSETLGPALKKGYTLKYQNRWHYGRDIVSAWLVVFKVGPTAYVVLACGPHWRIDGLFLRASGSS